MPVYGRRALYRLREVGGPMPAAGRGVRQQRTATATAKALALLGAGGGPGWCGMAGDAVNPQSGPAAGGCAFGHLRSSASQAKRPHPWGLGRRIHAAHTPAIPHHPGLDRFKRRSEWQRQERFLMSDGERTGSDPLLLFFFLLRGWTHTETVRGRAGGLGRGVRGMDAAAKPPWMGSRRPLPSPPARPTLQGQSTNSRLYRPTTHEGLRRSREPTPKAQASAAAG